MMITRRALSGSLTFLALAGSTFVVLDRQQDVGAFPGSLQRDLADWTRQYAPSSQATLVEPGLVTLPTGGVEISLRVNLTWPPGVRMTPYSTTAEDAEAAYRFIRDRVLSDLAAIHGVSFA